MVGGGGRVVGGDECWRDGKARAETVEMEVEGNPATTMAEASSRRN